MKHFWRQLFRREIVERELDEELQFHIERETEANVAAGMAVNEARRKALLSFGGVEQAKEECRDQRPTQWLESMAQDVRYGLRTLRKNPSFTVVAVLTLALGIGANTAIFSLVYATLVKPLPYEAPDHLITLRGNQSIPDTMDIGRESRTLEHMGAFADWPLDMLDRSKPEQVMSAIVDGDVFPALGVNPQQGRYLRQEDSEARRPVAVISDAFWHRYMGANPNVLGQKLTLSGNVYTVIGVMPRGFGLPRGESELWIPFTVGYPEAVNARGAHFTFAVGRIRTGVTLAQAQAELNGIGAELGRRYPEEARKFIVMQLRDRMVAGVRTPLLVLFGAVSFVLLIACVNFSSLLMTRTAGRQREFQIRMSLGASRWRVLRQIVTESVVVACVGAVAGIFLAGVGTRVLMQLKPKDVTGLDGSVFSFVTLAFANRRGVGERNNFRPGAFYSALGDFRFFPNVGTDLDRTDAVALIYGGGGMCDGADTAHGCRTARPQLLETFECRSRLQSETGVNRALDPTSQKICRYRLAS
jgi:putative ABC transport system permease protein